MRVFELATWHGHGDLDNGPSKSAVDATETGSWGCQVDNQEMGEVAASWEAERGSVNWGALQATMSWKHGIMGKRKCSTMS